MKHAIFILVMLANIVYSSLIFEPTVDFTEADTSLVSALSLAMIYTALIDYDYQRRIKRLEEFIVRMYK